MNIDEVKGHTHALIIADLYSLYISFIPMKSKSAEATASALRNYISFMGVPKVLLTDNDPTFRSEVTTLLASFNIQHQTSFPYMQRGNTVESQVRKFLNAARAAIADSPIAKHAEWHVLYPLIIVRLNTLVSKYGLSREYVHFQQVLETHLPLIINIKLDQDIEDDLRGPFRNLHKVVYNLNDRAARDDSETLRRNIRHLDKISAEAVTDVY